MIRLKLSLDACHSERFAQQLKYELEHLPAGTLPLTQATTQGGYVDDSNVCATIIAVREEHDGIRARVGVFFNEIVAGCSCGDEPVSANAYCELRVSIDRTSAEAEFAVIGQ